jgi:hypothetical protein
MPVTAALTTADEAVDVADASGSAVSWAAIIAGAVATAALALVLVALGAGFGFSSVSPWSNTGPSLATVGVSAGIWLIIVQWLSAAPGGYLTGRLRSAWTGIHTDEVFFRDTAHGLLMWALSVVLSALLLTSATNSVLSGATRVAGTAVQGAATSAENLPAYFVDSLFRTDHPPSSDNGQQLAEAGRILTTSIGSGNLPAADKTYLAQLVAARTGLTQADAEKRVDNVFVQAKSKVAEVAEEARRSAAYLAFFLFLSWLIGAFVASAAAAYGGSQRDAFHAAFKN